MVNIDILYFRSHWIFLYLFNQIAATDTAKCWKLLMTYKVRNKMILVISNCFVFQDPTYWPIDF